MSNCKECGAQLGPKNKSGLCRKHVLSAISSRPGFWDRQREGVRRKFDTDPDYAANARKRARALGRDPELTKRRSQHFVENRIWERGTASQTAEIRKRAGQTLSATRLAWCPPEYRDLYREKIKRGRGAERSRAEIMALVEQVRMASLLPHIADAARHVATHDRCAVLRTDDGWRYGIGFRTDAELLAMAQRKGWAPLEVAA